jgi:hypothetical protein
MTFKRALRGGASHLVVAGVLTSLALAGCKPNNQAASSSLPPSAAPAPLAALPLASDSAPSIAPAPAASALPPAPPVRVGRLADPRQQYAFLDQAYAMNSAFADAPPDYTFDNGGGERPWVWSGDDRSVRMAEPLPGGGDRYYYYEPGQDAPYLVRDAGYAYGYDNGVLVAIYDDHGRALPPDLAARRADVAGRYLARARALYAASQQRQREAVAEANWRARRSAIQADREQWTADQRADQAWAAYHDEHQQADDQRWAAERYRREAQSARFAEQMHDDQQARRYWEASQQAQARAANQAQPGRGPGAPGFFGGGPRGPVSPPQQQAGAPPQGNGGTWQHRGEGQPPPPASVGPGPAQLAQQRAAEHQAQIDAARKAEAQDQLVRQAQANAARNAQLQVQQAHQAQVDAGHRAEAQAQAARQAQMDAAHRAQAQVDTAHKAEAQTLATHQAQADAARKAQIQSQADVARRAEAQAQLARRAQMDAAHRAQAQSQADAAHSAEAQRAQADAARKAQVQAQLAHQAQVNAEHQNAIAASQARSQADAARLAAEQARRTAVQAERHAQPTPPAPPVIHRDEPKPPPQRPAPPKPAVQGPAPAKPPAVVQAEHRRHHDGEPDAHP